MVKPDPPFASIESISDSGLVTISFSEDMKLLNLVEVTRIAKHTIMETGEPVFECKVI